MKTAFLLVCFVLIAQPELSARVASVDLGSTDVTGGLANSQRGQDTDGENDPGTCGPQGSTRQGRINRGSTDDDTADLYLYIVVDDEEVKGSSRLLISATVYDDPDFATAPAGVRLQYTNGASTGPADLPNSFAGHPVVLQLSGSGRWTRHTWAVEDAGFRTFMQGTSDFRFDFGPSQVCVDRVDVATNPPQIEATEHFVAAHYYPWYATSRWSYSECVAGALRLELVEPQPPFLGRYDSGSSVVIDQHLRWCAENGVNVLILEFIQPGSREDTICRTKILSHPRSGDVRFTVLYDWAIRFGSFEVTPARIAGARTDFDHLARTYFPHPSFLKVRGELPLVMIYVTRALTGDVQGLIDGIRESCASRGFGVFLVGDEFFFPSSPSTQKIARWDGIFGYDVYASRGGFWGSNGNLDFFLQRTITYRQTAEARGVKFFPSLAPGFNDRAIRRTCEDHPAMSRRLTSEAESGSLFREVLREIALPHVDSELPLVSITSFNEWHEDTQIEPTRGGGESTAVDSSVSGTAYTQGLVHDDYGLLFLEVIRDATLAFTGKVLDGDGPLAEADIEVLDGDSIVLSRRSFSTGAYVVPRLRLMPGSTYRLRASAPGHESATSDALTVLEDRAQTVEDLTLTTLPAVSRGDCNGDAVEDISDAVALFLHLFVAARSPLCVEACNIDGDEALSVSDSIHLLRFIFQGGPPPAAPAFPACEPYEGARQCEGGNCS